MAAADAPHRAFSTTPCCPQGAAHGPLPTPSVRSPHLARREGANLKPPTQDRQTQRDGAWTQETLGGGDEVEPPEHTLGRGACDSGPIPQDPGRAVCAGHPRPQLGTRCLFALNAEKQAAARSPTGSPRTCLHGDSEIRSPLSSAPRPCHRSLERPGERHKPLTSRGSS